jgi:ribosomal protein L11 methyltransferase
MLELFPEGFEESEHGDGIEVAGYGDAEREAAVRAEFEGVEASDVEEGWEDRWRALHRGVRIGVLWVGPPWEEPPAGATAVVVDPGRAFGTGAHPTTRLCLELLQRVPSGSLLDAGCGSGALAIAAAKLGFSPVVALDDDSAAIDAAIRNAEANAVAIDARLADVLSDPLPRVETAVANVTLEAVRALAPRIDGRRLVTAGYLETDALQLSGWVRDQRVTLDGWAADLWRQRE